jgi:CPA2 family monovalent cation:H+ antiporter-2
MVNTVLILLGASLLTTAFVQRLGLSPIIGFILVGLLVGPHGLEWVELSKGVRNMAEFGVVFLMFTIGLEFSLPRLLADKTLALGLGSLQLFITTLLVAGAAWFMGLPPVAAFAVGTALAMSSTAIVTRCLIEQAEMNSRFGRTAVYILLFQDLATIVILLILPELKLVSNMSLAGEIITVLVKGILVFIFLLLLGRWAVRPFFRQVAVAHSPESFMLAVLLVSLAAAQFAHAWDLSLLLGGFMAGVVLGETEFKHQVEADIRPFQDVLLGLFFITIGMLVDLQTLVELWPLVLGLSAALILGKALIITSLSKGFGLPLGTAMRTGVVLAQGGEFSLVILFLAMETGLLMGSEGQVILIAVVLSMALAPVLIRYNAVIAERLAGVNLRKTRQTMAEDVRELAGELNDHVILCGYGRVGQNVARFLSEEGVEYIALDLDPYRLRATIDSGERVTYGDTTRRHILIAAGLERAQAVVITYNNTRTALKTLSHIHELRPDVTALVRAVDEVSLEELLNAGATEVIPDTLEASLTLASHLLTLLGFPLSKVAKRSNEIRADRYRLLRGFFHGRERFHRRDRLQVVKIPGNAYAVGRQLKHLQLNKHQVTVTAVRRHGIRGIDPDPEMQLEAGDALILHGKPESLQRMERYLISGKL